MDRSSALCSAGASVILNRSNTPPSLTLTHVSPATRLLEKRRQMFEVQEALEMQKLDFTRRQDSCHRREDELRKKDAELQKSLIKFNKFLQENEAKHTRALKRANDEVKVRLTKEHEIIKLQRQLTALEHESQNLALQVRRHRKYMRYLELVQETALEEYPEVKDLMNRYQTLRETNRDLSRTQLSHELESEANRLEFATFQKERANEILTFNNRLAALKRALERQESRGKQLQHETDAALRSTTEKTLALGQIIMAIGNLLQRSTSGTHGQLLKHVERHYHLPNSNASTTVSSTGLSDAEILHHGERALIDLNIVAAYLMDFTAIVHDRIDAQRSQKKAGA